MRNKKEEEEKTNTKKKQVYTAVERKEQKREGVFD